MGRRQDHWKVPKFRVTQYIIIRCPDKGGDPSPKSPSAPLIFTQIVVYAKNVCKVICQIYSWLARYQDLWSWNWLEKFLSPIVKITIFRKSPLLIPNVLQSLNTFLSTVGYNLYTFALLSNRSERRGPELRLGIYPLASILSTLGKNLKNFGMLIYFWYTQKVINEMIIVAIPSQ